MRVPAVSLLAVAAGGCHLVFGAAVPDTVDAPDDAAIDAPDPMFEIGCADGTREGFDLGLDPAIAGCSGGWSVAGVAAARTGCAATGNDSVNPTGIGCSIADLCAPGWHVCTDRVDAGAHLSARKACTWEADVANEGVFFASAQPAAFSRCDWPGTDDLYGCGSLGRPPALDAQCEPFGRSSGNECDDIRVVGGWLCSGDHTAEAAVVTKTSPLGGGALCCRDPAVD